MISSLHGTVAHARTDAIDVVVGGAVGFSVAVPADIARSARIGDAIDLETSLIVREGAMTLYGFATRADVALFGMLMSVSGVGPRSALGILSHLSADQIAQAVVDDDDGPFRKVSGVGPKTAKLIVVQLAGKLAPPAAVTDAVGSAPAATTLATQVTAALVGLGWSERVALEAIEEVTAGTDEPERSTVPAFLRLTLAHLGPARRNPGDG